MANKTEEGFLTADEIIERIKLEPRPGKDSFLRAILPLLYKMVCEYCEENRKKELAENNASK